MGPCLARQSSPLRPKGVQEGLDEARESAQIGPMAPTASRADRLMRTYLLLVARLLVPIALSYGVAPATILPRFLDIAVPGPDQTEIFRALMCLYLAASTFWAIAAFKPAWQRAAVIWAIFFSFSLAIGRW